MDIEKLKESIDPGKMWGMVIEYGGTFLLAIATLIIGLWLIKRAGKGFRKAMEKRELEPSLRHFLHSLIDILLKILLAISVVSMLGVEMTSFVALLGAAGLAIGLSLQGTLQNFAGGVIILLFKPFKVGDVIETSDHFGKVHEIQIIYTILLTFDNRTIIIPNGNLSNASLTNYTKQNIRRLEWKFGISYGDDSEKAREVIMNIIRGDERVLKEPEPTVVLNEMADSSVVMMARAWSTLDDFWNIYWELNEKVYKELPKHGITFPFPQMDVHLDKE